jgi:hypothetical protein
LFAVTVAVPSLPPVQATFLLLLIEEVSSEGDCAIVTVAVLVQPY